MHSWTAIWRHPEFRRGALDMSGPAVGIGAWGLVTGVAMVKSGLSVSVALAMTLVVFAGSAQLAVLPLLAAGAPTWVVWATAACVNLRFVVVSVQFRPYLGVLPLAQRMRMAYFAADLNYVMFVRRFPRPEPGPGQPEYFWGGVAPTWTSWQVMSVAGILLGDRVPAHWGLGFAGILVLIGLTCALLSDRATWAAAAAAAAVAMAAHALPLKLNIVMAIIAAVAVGLALDRQRPSPTGTAGGTE